VDFGVTMIILILWSNTGLVIYSISTNSLSFNNYEQVRTHVRGRSPFAVVKSNIGQRVHY